MLVQKRIEKALAILQEQFRSEKLKNNNNILIIQTCFESKENMWKYVVVGSSPVAVT